jgi:hypothetical protein
VVKGEGNHVLVYAGGGLMDWKLVPDSEGSFGAMPKGWLDQL